MSSIQRLPSTQKQGNMSQMRKLINPWKSSQDWHNVRISKDRKIQIKLPEMRTTMPKMKNALGWNDWISADKK